MDYDGNFYYNPEASGLAMVASIDFRDDYDFDIIAVWKEKETGKMYYAGDSGCSCPSPFEDYNSLADLNPLNENTLDEFRSYVKERAEWGYGVSAMERGNFLRSVTMTLRHAQK